MATRSRTSFQKRQKEVARMEKQKEKADRRLQRKREAKDAPESNPDQLDAPDDFDIGPATSTADPLAQR